MRSGKSAVDDAQQLSPRGLERRLKRHLLGSDQSFLAVTTPGFEPILAGELAAVADVTVGPEVVGGVEFGGPLDLVYTTNLRLRTASKVLLRIDTFVARSYPELFNKSRRIPWELYIGFAGAVSFSVSSRGSRLHHTDNISKAVYDGILESMKKLGRAPRCKDDAPIRFNIRFFEDHCTISLDSSGEHLYKRGYRTSVGRAPLRENTASALLLASDWESHDVIVDPLCGSGGILLECAMLARNRSPGVNRSFAFQNWPSFSQSKFDRFRKNAIDAEHDSAKTIVGSDKSSAAVNAARQNVSNGGVGDVVELRVESMQKVDFTRFGKQKGLLVSNLPYGKRIGTEREAQALYSEIGSVLKKHCAGWSFGFVATETFQKSAALNVRNVIRFENGGLPVGYFQGVV